MRTDKEMDEILRCALTQKTEPDAALQRKVLGTWKENKTMKVNKTWAAVVTAACVLAVGIPAGAAVRYLSADKVAENLVSIEKEDGTPMPDTEDAQLFTVKPFIGGFDPLRVNPLYAEGSFAAWDVIDGVQYQIYGVSNLECFADHSLYVCVSDSITYNTEEYHYKEDGTVSGHGTIMDSPESAYDSEKYMFGETGGVISRNENYKGVNALFEIQLDASKADRAKAEEYLKQFEKFGSADDAREEENGEVQQTQEYVDFVKNGDWKAKIENAELKLGPTEVKRDKNGECPFEMKYELNADDGSECSGTLFFYDADFIDGTAVQTQGFGGDDTYYEQTSVAEKTDDDTITVKVYLRKMTQEEIRKGSLLESN